MEIGALATNNVVTVGPEHSLREAATRMVRSKVGSAVVLTDDGQPGIITERDLLRAVADSADLDARKVGEYMTANAITASHSWDVATAAKRMNDGSFRHLIVLDDGGQVAGMLSVRDLVKALLEP